MVAGRVAGGLDVAVAVVVAGGRARAGTVVGAVTVAPAVEAVFPLAFRLRLLVGWSPPAVAVPDWFHVFLEAKRAKTPKVRVIGRLI